MPNDRDIQFGALKIFAAVAEAETLTHAAQQLGISQSAVSQAIAQLEQTAAVPLVVRRSRPIKLTPSGQVLRVHAQEILNRTRRMLAAVQNASETGLLQLTIGMIDSFGDAMAEHLIERIKPMAMQLSLVTGYSAPLSHVFLHRDADILITSDPMDEHRDIERHAILRDPFVMIVAANQVAEESPDPELLANTLPFIRYTRSSRLGKHTDLVKRRLNLKTQTRYELDSTQTLLRFVQSGHGWAMTTGLCLVRYPELLRGVRVLPMANSVNARYLSLFARTDELGENPLQLAGLCRDIFDQDVLPRITRLVPWLKDEARSITEVPII